MILLLLFSCSEPARRVSDGDAAPDAAPLADAAPDAGDLVPWTWTVETVDADGRGDPSIAIGEDAVAHVTYYALPSDLRYADDASGAFSPEVIDDFPDTGGWSSVVVAPDGIRVSYHDYDGGRLVFAKGGPGAWTIETLDTGPRGNGSWTAQALDADGHSHVAFSRVTSTDRDLAYATDEIGAWAAETVDTEGLGGEHAAIAMDREGALHVVHVETGGVVRHAVRSGAEWAIETVPLPEAANDVSIAAADAVRLLWSGSDSGALHLASYESGWTDEIVDDTGVVRGVAIAVDADGALHALYHRAERCDAGAPCDRGDLVHASNASGTWHGEVADAEGATGFTPEAAFAPDGSVEVVYLRQDLPAILRAVGRAP